MRIPKKLEDFMEMISNESGLDRFILFGGNVIDFFLGKKFNLCDIDILIEANNKSERREIINNLKRRGFQVSRERKYLVCRDREVFLLQAKKEGFLLDISICPNPKTIPGPFNAQSIYCEYPEINCNDKHSSLSAVKSKKFEYNENRGFKKENPLILLGRFLLLCTKYDGSLLFPKEHKIFIEEFNSEKRKRKEQDFDAQNISSLLSKILTSILRSKNKNKFLSEVLDSNILDGIYDSLKKPLTTLSVNPDLNKIKDKRSLVNIILNNSSGGDRKNLKRLFKTMSRRLWDKEDYSIYKNIN